MKQSKVSLSIVWIAFLFSVSFGYSIEERQAYNYAYQNGITTMSSINKADMWWNLTRIAMAKMLSNYAINILGLNPDTSKYCNFSDVSSSLDYQYDYWVLKACQLGLMGVWISNFRPNDTVTRAEFGTVLSRALNARNTTRLAQMNNAEPYYSEHLKYLKEEWIMNNISNPSSLERRWRVMLMLMRADKNYEPEVIDYPTTYSANKIETTYVETPWCDWMTRTQSPYGYEVDMPNKNWTDDIKFVNKALQDVRDNWEHLVKNYIAEANRVLDSAWLTKRDQCRYSLLINELENQKWFIKSYKNENWKVIIGIDFLSYKENITWNDFQTERGGGWDLIKNTSEKARYYTLSDNVNLETFNIDEDWFVHKNNQWNYCAYTSDWNARLNSFCNGEPVYNWVKYPSEWSSYEPERAGQYYNRNGWWYYCIKNYIVNQIETFRFDSEWNIDQISTNYCGWFTESPFVS